MAAQAGPYLGIQFQNGTSVQTTPFVAGYGGVDSQGGWMRSMCLASVLYVQVLGLQHELAKGNFAHPKKNSSVSYETGYPWTDTKRYGVECLQRLTLGFSNLPEGLSVQKARQH